MIVGFEPAISRFQIMNRSHYATSVGRYTASPFKPSSNLRQTAFTANPISVLSYQSCRGFDPTFHFRISNPVPITTNLHVLIKFNNWSIEKSVLRRRWGVRGTRAAIADLRFWVQGRVQAKEGPVQRSRVFKGGLCSRSGTQGWTCA